MSNVMKAVFYKELQALKAKKSTFMFSILSIAIFITGFNALFNKDQGFSIQNEIPVLQIYMGITGFILSLNFWTEKISGSLEYVLSHRVSLRTFIVCKITFNLVVGLVALLCFTLVLAIFYPQALTSLGGAIVVYALLAFPYGLINGYTMTCCSRGVATILQCISIVFIFSSVFLIRSITNSSENTVFIYSIIIFIALLWLIGLVMILKATAEKAITTSVE
jgi:ABC-type transport system involved in cytochrome c biogenesis permease component